MFSVIAFLFERAPLCATLTYVFFCFPYVQTKTASASKQVTYSHVSVEHDFETRSFLSEFPYNSNRCRMASIHNTFARKQVGGTQKRGKPEMRSHMQNISRFALVSLGPAWPRVCKCPPPPIPVSQLPF